MPLQTPLTEAHPCKRPPWVPGRGRDGGTGTVAGQKGGGYPRLPPLPEGPRPGCGLLSGAGLSLESLLTNMRCKCIKSTAQAINLGLILAIDVTPPGIHCRRKEIM